MTTDITELAQRMKAAAEKATHGQWLVTEQDCRWNIDDESGRAIAIAQQRTPIRDDYKQAERTANAEFIALANPANILALVEALEKAQQVDEELCKLLPPGVEYMDPPDGGDVTPLEGVRRMVADYRQRIAELELRTVKLPEPFELAWLSGGSSYYYADEVDAALTAQGIKVEAE